MDDINPSQEIESTPDLEIADEAPVVEAAAEKPVVEAKAQTEEEKGEAIAEAELKGEKEQKEDEGYKPQLRFKAGVYNKETREVEQKEYDIDKRFHPLMKDAESEKLVRELHEKAFGLDSVKDRLTETRTLASQVSEENRAIKASIDSVRGIYKDAMETGNLLKLDKFFDKLKIPEAVVAQYILAKAKLAEMPPEQQNAIMGQMRAETQAEEAAGAQSSLQQRLAQEMAQTRTIQLQLAMEVAGTKSIADAFDARVGQPGAFKREVINQGKLVWHETQGRTDLSPQQAIEQVVAKFGLQAPAPGVTQAPPAPGNVQNKVIVRTDRTIPNVGAGRSASPLKSKPRSIEDLQTLYKQASANG